MTRRTEPLALAERIEQADIEVTPKMIAAAWAAWKERHHGSIGPGPGFVEAIRAAFAARALASTEPT